MFSLCDCCCVVARALLLASLGTSSVWAQAGAAQGGWQGLAKLLDAITPSADTSIPPSAAQMTERIANLLTRGMYPEALQEIAARKAALEETASEEAALEATVSPGTDVQLLFLEARALAALQRHDEAIVIYRHMTERYPELPEPWNNLAAQYVRLNQIERAHEALNMALTADPHYATAQANLGMVQLMLAQQSLQRAAQSGIPGVSSQAQEVRRLLSQ